MNQPSISKALVTGGNGFLGQHLVQALTANGTKVGVLYLEGTDTSQIQDICETLWAGNICDPTTLPQAMEGVDVVFHLAAMVTDWGPAASFHEVNVRGTQHVLEAAIQAGCKRFVHISSLAVHQYRHITAGDETRPRDTTYPAYATTKKAAEDVVMARAHEIEVVLIRPGLFPYGPGDIHNISLIFDTIERGIFGYIDGGKAQFCTSYATNLADGLVLAGSHPQAKGEIFVLCDDEAISWRTFGKSAAQQLKCKAPRLSLPFWLVFPFAWFMEGLWKLLRIRKAPPLTRYRINVARYHLVFSNQKAKQLLGYQPKVRWDEGIATTVQWYQQRKQSTPRANKTPTAPQ